MKTMKYFLLALISLSTAYLKAQGLEGIIVERYYLANAADVANAVAQGAVVPLTTNTVAYRVYVDMAPGYEFSQVYGNAAHNLVVNTTTNFYNDPTFGVAVNPGTTSFNSIRRHTTMIDSWFTTGGTSAGRVGVMEAEDTDGSVGNLQSILANNPGGCYGLPINGTGAQDGMTTSSPSTYLAPNTLGLGTALDVLDQTAGNSIVISNGTIAALGGIVGPTASNRVLIAQFTTDGTLSFNLNVQVVNIATGNAENYVSSNPAANELTHPTLTFISGQAPTVSIATPTNNSTVAAGTPLTISANANDNGGIVTSVQFYIDNVLFGTDNSAPFSVNYTPTSGAHTVYAVATDNDCQTTTSSTINFTASSNQAPTINVSAPASVLAGSNLLITATAADSDGTVAQVEFFVNGVSVGIDNMSPFTFNYTTMIGNNQSIYAIATDNQGASTTSSTIFFNAVANSLPSVSITAPLNNSSFVAPAVVTISANAADTDGTISQVQFFVNGVSVGIDNTSPYSVNWTSVIGNAVITAVATDNNGGVATSSAINVNIADPNALPYFVQSIETDCNASSFCVPVGVSITAPVDNVIGYDFVLGYNENEVQPTGNVIVYETLTGGAAVEAVAVVGNAGELNISLTFSSGGAEFNGSGLLFCAEFERLAGFGASSESDMEIVSVFESYITQVIEQSGSAGTITSTVDYSYTGSLAFWSDSSPIAYNTSSPSDFLITNIFGSEDGSIINSAIQPDVNGSFDYNLLDATAIQIDRDILENVAVQPVVNAADAIIAKSLLNGIGTPSIYEILAMDVNLDGMVSAGDITQIKQRAVGAIAEYQQAWNYDINGISNGQPSKDWVFVSDFITENDPTYAVSSTFPNDDAVGYSVNRVPVVPFELPLTVSNFSNDGTLCPTVESDTFRGIMLGDINGSYANYQADGEIRGAGSHAITFDFSSGTYVQENGEFFVDVPVSLTSNFSTVNAIDFWFAPNAEKLEWVSATSAQNGFEVLSNNDTFNSVSRFTGSTSDINEGLSLDQDITIVRFRLVDPCAILDESDFSELNALVNDEFSQINFLFGPENEVSISTSTVGAVCSNESIVFSATSVIASQEVTAYTWSLGDGTESTLAEPSVVYTGEGTYPVLVGLITDAGCEFFATLDVTVLPAPVVNFTYDVNTTTFEVSFVNQSFISSGEITSYEWDFGNGATSTETGPVVIYNGAGTYTVTLEATSGEGCSSIYSDAVQIVVGLEELSNSSVNVYPNPATDVLYIAGNDLSEIRIHDAQGKLVFEKESIKADNFTLNVSEFSAGVYHVIVRSNNESTTKKLVVTR